MLDDCSVKIKHKFATPITGKGQTIDSCWLHYTKNNKANMASRKNVPFQMPPSYTMVFTAINYSEVGCSVAAAAMRRKTTKRTVRDATLSATTTDRATARRESEAYTADERERRASECAGGASALHRASAGSVSCWRKTPPVFAAVVAVHVGNGARGRAQGVVWMRLAARWFVPPSRPHGSFVRRFRLAVAYRARSSSSRAVGRSCSSSSAMLRRR